MRCLACNAELTDIESTRKNPNTGEFVDLCGECLGAIRAAEFEDEYELDSVVSVVTDENM